jgi:Tol biopolymer transport system component
MALAASCAAGLAQAQTTELASVSSYGLQGNNPSHFPALSADGRFVAFASTSNNLVAGDTNGQMDVFMHDRQLGTTEILSLTSAWVPGNGGSGHPSLTANGRFVAFDSLATNLVPGDTNGLADIFVRDRLLGRTERVSVATGGAQEDFRSFEPSISADGRFVTFTSAATNLVAGDTNGVWDVFVRDRLLGTTERVSLDSGGVQGDSDSSQPSISADGRFVAFHSSATNLVAGDTNGSDDVFVRDRQRGTTERVSVDTYGIEADSDSDVPSISADGRFVAFDSFATNLVVGDTNGVPDIFVRDRQSGITERVSVDSSGIGGNSGSGDFVSISADGRVVAFFSVAFNLVPGDTNRVGDLFVHDRESYAIERVSVATGGSQGNLNSEGIAISADGRFVAFYSSATNLVAGDTNGYDDVFVRDRGAVAPGTDRCEPGPSGVIACPCTNRPAGPGRGCDNKEVTGGASLTASGSNSLSNPTLVFTTAGENATATSILLQGSVLTTGVVFGHGVRCLGAFKRMYAKTCAGGSVTMPNLSTDLSTAARSAALGDPILVLQKRWYQVYYQDTTLLLGGCPLASTQFNATNVQEILWLP